MVDEEGREGRTNSREHPGTESQNIESKMSGMRRLNGRKKLRGRQSQRTKERGALRKDTWTKLPMMTSNGITPERSTPFSLVPLSGLRVSAASRSPVIRLGFHVSLEAG